MMHEEQLLKARGPTASGENFQALSSEIANKNGILFGGGKGKSHRAIASQRRRFGEKPQPDNSNGTSQRRPGKYLASLKGRRRHFSAVCVAVGLAAVLAYAASKTKLVGGPGTIRIKAYLLRVMHKGL